MRKDYFLLGHNTVQSCISSPILERPASSTVRIEEQAMCANKRYIYTEKMAPTDPNSVKNSDPPSPYACTIFFTLTALF